MKKKKEIREFYETNVLLLGEGKTGKS